MAKPQIIGSAYKGLKSIVEKYAQAGSSVLFVGETGVGKELLANHYKECSGISKERSKSVNCVQFPEALLPSEIFGHVKGAFTGATRDKPGFIEVCNGGILFLDELGSASREFQTLILRVIEYGKFNRVGSTEEKNSSAVIIAATNNLGGVREELRHRFDRILPVPPLQKSDIPVLAKHFLGKPLKREILEELMGLNYSGNVRELKQKCNQVKIERGDEIFDKKDSFSKYSAGVFDHERFEREFFTWQKHIQPLIERYELPYKYRYLLYPEERRGEHLTQGESTDYLNVGSKPDMRRLIEYLNNRQEEMPVTGDVTGIKVSILDRFIENLKQQFEYNELPYLLDALAHHFDNAPAKEDVLPDLIPLLEETNCKKAEIQFQLAHIDYHLRKHKYDEYKAAVAIGLKSEKELKQKRDRLEERLSKS